MSYIYKVNIPEDNQNVNYLIEPLLYIEPTKNGVTYSANLSDFSLVQGAAIQVKFTNASVGNDTLSINSQAKSIYYKGSAITAGAIQADSTYTLVYNGTVWEIVGDLDTDTIYTLPHAEANVLGGIKVGYTTNDKNYKVQLDSNNNAYVSVPWTDTTYEVFNKSGTNHTTGLVPDPGATEGNTKFLREDGTWTVPSYLTIGTTASTAMAGNTAIDKVKQEAVGDTYSNWRPLVISAANNATEGFSPSTVTGTTYITSTITAQPSTGTIRATTFKGNASSATQVYVSGIAIPSTSRVTYFIQDTDTTDGNRDLKIHNRLYLYENTTATYLNVGRSSETSSRQGGVTIHAGNKYYGDLIVSSNLSENRTYTLPNKTGTIALISDIPTNLNQLTNGPGYTTNTGTVTSVRIQASSPLQSSSDTAQNVSLDTTISFQNQNKNVVLAGPTTSDSAAPTFRSLVAADIPDLSDTYLTGHQTIKQDGLTGATINRYGTCSTAAGTAAKTVSVTSGTVPTLDSNAAGLKITVKFTNANTAGTPTLNVNSKGAKNIYHRGAQITTGVNKALLAGVCDFIFDGTQWHLVGNYYDTTYSRGTATSGGTALSLVNTGDMYTWNNKQNALAFDGTYNSSSNKVATVSTVTNAINALDGGTIGTGSTTKTITALSQTDGKVSATFDNIAFPVTSVGGKTGDVTISDLGLSNALHFIGITSTSLTDGSTTSTLTAKSTNSLSKTTGFADGDVVMDNDQLREYVWSGNAWRLLGITTSEAYSQTATGNSWITSITQGTDGKITATTGTLNTSGTWSGTAATITAGESTSNLARPVWFSYSDNGTSYINGKLGYNANFMYNPSTGALQVGNTSTGSILVGSATASTAGTGERQVGVKNGSGRLYLYATAATNGNKGLYAYATNQSTGGAILTVNQSNQISGIATLACSPTITGILTLTRTQDVVLTGTDATKPALIIGESYSKQHLEFDDNEIQSKSNATTANTLFINNLGGAVDIGTASDGYLKARYTTDSSSTSTGALQVSGGAGIGKTLYVGSQAVVAKIKIGNGSTDAQKRTITVTDTNLIFDVPASQQIIFQQGATTKIRMNGLTFYPETSTGSSVGTSSNKWANIYATTFNGNLIATHADGGKEEIKIAYSNTISFWLGIGTANENHGLYDDKAGKWILLAGAANTWTFVGNVTGNVSGSAGSVAWENTGHPDTFPPTIGTTATTAMAGNTTVTNVAISADTTTNKNYALVFGTTPSDGTTPTAEKTEGLQKNSAKFYVNPSTGALYATKLYSGSTEVSVSGHTHNESDITWSNKTLYPIGDDIYIGDVNLGGHLGLKSKSASYNTGLIFIKQNTNNDATTSTTGGRITWDGTKFSITSTTAVDASISGNAGTATEFSSNATVALTGDVTGTSSGSKKGWSVATTLADSGVTADTYGVATTGTQNISHSGTFTVPYFTVDSKGRITTAGTKTYQLPSSGNSDHYPSAWCETAAGTQAKTATCTEYVLTNNTWLHVLIKNANSYNGKITLNVNSKGAKDIWINGAVSSSSNKTLPAGTYLVYYDGTQYHFRTDGTLPGNALTASTASQLQSIEPFNVYTGSSTKQHITLETLMNWLINTKKYIPSGIQCYRYLVTKWEYANNDILKLTCEETNYELQLAGCVIEFWGSATAYNAGVFRLRIHSSPTVSFTSTSGYTKFPSSAIAEYTCNDSSFTPTWRMYYAEPASTTPTLSWGNTATIGKVNGKEFKVTAMAKPSYSYSDISSRPTSIKLTGAVTGSVTLANGENSIATTVNHTHNYAGSSSAGGAANSVANNLVIKLKSGSTEGTDLYTYNGSGAKTLDIKQGSNITLTAAAGSLTIAGTANNAVTQTAIDTNGEYSILLKKNANKTDETTGTNYVKTKSVTVNPSTATVSAIQYYATGSTGANSSTPGFKCTVNANAWSYMALESGTTAWHIAVNNKASDDNTHVGALQFRPNGLNNTGPSIMTTGEINRWVNTTSNVPLIAMRANNKDAVLWEIGHAAHPYDAFSNHSYKMIYKGTGDGVNNTLQLVADYTSDTIAMQINLEGRTTFQERIGLHTGTSSVTEKVTLEWNSTDQSLDFIFA